jgi:NAD(P)-dependent dehydrogenase (short-subunit alcohol dehydrogenase family)
MLTETWAEELKESKVVVNCVHPGWVDTPLLRAAGPMEGFYKYVFGEGEREGGREGGREAHSPPRIKFVCH